MKFIFRLLFAVTILATAVSAGARGDEAAWSALRERNAVMIVRHAQTVPGIGDPPGFRLDDCASQRNLSDAGRAQAASMGRLLAESGIRVSRVESSRWCRCIDTAREAFPRLPIHPFDALNSFFGARDAEARQTNALRDRVGRWQGPGVLVLVTHQVNITALAGRSVAMGEALVLLPETTAPRVIGAVQF